MSETDPSLLADIGKSLATIVGALGLSGYLVKRNSSRVDELLRDAVPREEFNQMVQSIRNEISAVRDEQARGVAGTHSRLDDILLLMAKGNLNGQDNRGAGRRAERCD